MAYLDGELSNDRTAVVVTHLSECAECREVVTELRDVSQALTTWSVGTVDTRIPSALSSALDEKVDKPVRIPIEHPVWRIVLPRRWQSAAWIGAFATIAAVAYFGSFTLRAKMAIDNDSSANHREAPGSLRDYAYAPSLSQESRTAPVVAGGLVSQKPESLERIAPLPPSKVGEANAAHVSGPMIIRTAQLALITKDFDNARSSVDAILKRHRGYVGELKVGGSTGSGRTLTATLRVPADQLDASLTDLKTLGRVETESQRGQDVTSQYVDLQARLANARNTEQRLTDLLRQRTGKLSDVLEVEQEVDRVRGEIEQMEAERKNMSNQVSFATLNATITEDYKAQLQVVPPSTSTRLSNAAVAGYKSMVDGMVGLALFLLENIPTLLFWLAVLFIPVRLVWKRVRRSFAH
jgi:hypothetical protein